MCRTCCQFPWSSISKSSQCDDGFAVFAGFLWGMLKQMSVTKLCREMHILAINNYPFVTFEKGFQDVSRVPEEDQGKTTQYPIDFHYLLLIYHLLSVTYYHLLLISMVISTFHGDSAAFLVPASRERERNPGAKVGDPSWGLAPGPANAGSMRM